MRVGVGTVIDSVSVHAEPHEAALSFDEAFTLYHRAVFSTARAIVRDSALAEEVTQEVFLKLFRHLDSAPRNELLRPWLLRVTLNEARNTIRGRNRALARDANYQRTNIQRAETECGLEIEAARQALDKVKEPMRSCLLLRHQGLSYREIAQTLSLKENYVGSLIARARKQFAGFAQKSFGASECLATSRTWPQGPGVNSHARQGVEGIGWKQEVRRTDSDQ